MSKLLVILAYFAPLYAPSFAASIEGEYEGPVDGGKAYLTLKNAKGTSVDVSVVIADTSDGCGGSLKGQGTLKDQTIVLSTKNELSGGDCELKLVMQSDGMKASEKNCMDSHGHSCSFNSFKGPLVQTASPKPARAAPAKKP